MAQAYVALRSARAYLNDTNGITWTDHVLMPLLQEAHGEMIQELQRYNISVILNQSTVIFVPAFSTNLGTNQPEGLVEPISIDERVPGQDQDAFMPMARVTFIPLEDQDDVLTYWAWLGQVITFLGATTNREILLRYKGTLATPRLATDPLGFIFAERFIGARIASIAKESVGQDGSNLQNLADLNLHKIMQSNIVNDQRPTRRRPYRAFKGLYGPEGSANISGVTSGPGGTVVNWIATSTPADGIRSAFTFSGIPKWVSWNGVNQFQGIGYTLAVSSGGYAITFIDGSGNILVPMAGDDIRMGV